ncbi:FAD dependent oxidoreductase-domain-containing protein [Mycena latifolia]|nr:FAD dependent oxidoreductase-domain-containing protein [Mycena latifolia]
MKPNGEPPAVTYDGSRWIPVLIRLGLFKGQGRGLRSDVEVVEGSDGYVVVECGGIRAQADECDGGRADTCTDAYTKTYNACVIRNVLLRLGRQRRAVWDDLEEALRVELTMEGNDGGMEGAYGVQIDLALVKASTRPETLYGIVHWGSRRIRRRGPPGDAGDPRRRVAGKIREINIVGGWHGMKITVQKRLRVKAKITLNVAVEKNEVLEATGSPAKALLRVSRNFASETFEIGPESRHATSSLRSVHRRGFDRWFCKGTMKPARMDASPGFPHPAPCLSFWLQGARNSTLLGHRTTGALLATADVTIIGSGLSGAAIAYFLLTGPNPPARVTLLEAREACHGATARNGGHCRPDCYRDYPHYKATFGREQALKIIQNEMVLCSLRPILQQLIWGFREDTLNLVGEIIEKEGIECDFWRGFSYEVPMDQAGADYLAASYQAFVADGGPVEGIVEQILDQDQARRAATAAYRFPAGSLWPYKLVAYLLTLCITKQGLNLQTNTPVRKVVSRPGVNCWTVKTDRGDLDTRQVVFATNAFTATLLPEFTGHIWPFRGQCAAAVPTKAYSGNNMLTHTYGLEYGDYLIQRPSDGVIIFGGQVRSMPVDKLRGNTNDSERYPEMTRALKEALPRYFEGWGEEALGEGLIHDWSGAPQVFRDERLRLMASRDKAGRADVRQSPLP